MEIKKQFVSELHQLYNSHLLNGDQTQRRKEENFESKYDVKVKSLKQQSTVVYIFFYVEEQKI